MQWVSPPIRCGLAFQTQTVISLRVVWWNHGTRPLDWQWHIHHGRCDIDTQRGPKILVGGGTNTYVRWYNGAIERSRLTVTRNETGTNNAGADFLLGRYKDDGTSNGNALLISVELGRYVLRLIDGPRWGADTRYQHADVAGQFDLHNWHSWSQPAHPVDNWWAGQMVCRPSHQRDWHWQCRRRSRNRPLRRCRHLHRLTTDHLASYRSGHDHR